MAMKKIAVIGKPGFISHSYRKSLEQLNKEVGLNTGNLAFWYAMSEHVIGEKDYFGWTVDPRVLAENYDVIMFPAANQLNPDWDMDILANLFEKANLPLLIIGLGAQADYIGEKLKFNAGSKRFMRVISERAYKIGVRGEYTAQVLHENGVENIEITGCPSNFINPNPELGRLIENKLSNLCSIDRVAINVDITQKLKDVLPIFSKWGSEAYSEIICQAPIEVLTLAHFRTVDLPPNVLDKYRKLFAPSLSPDAFTKLVDQSFSTYFDTTEWLYKLRKFDISVGTRMHGNMLAFQAETPCILFPHDSRLSELVDGMKLPRYSLDKLTSTTSLAEVVQKCEFNAKSYDSNRVMLAKRYTDIINKTGLDFDSSLRSLANY
ncbi:polysaccharide pyruvyl transferase family protein [Aestuariibacter salexigens]|uniref:polysaccharide pyruvyl transferase family protein n=1 Tax=Aestuariibacter salexigens TaxID=226010 RepID=UPI00146FB1A4|nr:polysaccharide pyruvyl transferase family protein [Aestuariibacter salexigens]